MAKSMRSNRKKALRTIRRNEVKTSAAFAEREAEKNARLQKTVEAGKAARELAEQARVAPMAEDRATDATPAPGGGAMEVDGVADQALRRRGVLLTKKKKLKLRRRMKAGAGQTKNKRKAQKPKKRKKNA